MEKEIYFILLAGGSGKRLWPFRNDSGSKQFLKIFKTEDGCESMLQRVYRQIRAAAPSASVIVAAGCTQVPAIRDQLGAEIEISEEPARRDTFPAVALAAAYLHDVLGISEDQAVVVCPVDTYAENGYFGRFREMYETAQNSDRNLVLMGIRPSCPSEKYGYIKPVQKTAGPDGSTGDGRAAGKSSSSGGDRFADGVHSREYVFIEKPSSDRAAEYIAQGALWNSGVFAFKLKYVLNRSRELLGTADYASLLANCESLESISFDYALAEGEPSLEVLEYTGPWKDLGTWNEVAEMMEKAEEPAGGNVLLDEKCSNVHVINELGIPILVMGLKNAVIAATPEGILISDQDQSSSVKPYIEVLEQL